MKKVVVLLTSLEMQLAHGLGRCMGKLTKRDVYDAEGSLRTIICSVNISNICGSNACFAVIVLTLPKYGEGTVRYSTESQSV
jgi:hypothetical protein